MKGTDHGYGPRERPRTPMIKKIDRLPGMSHSGNSFHCSVSKTHIHTAEGALGQHKRPMAQALGFLSLQVWSLTLMISSAPHK